MKPNEFFICYLTTPSEVELELTQKYWEFDISVDKFKYTTTTLKSIGVPIKGSLSTVVGNICYLSTSKYFICPKCGINTKILNREQLKRLIRKTPEQCPECEKAQINNQAKLNLDLVKRFVESYKLPSTQDVNSISYLESIYLIIMLERLDSSGRLLLLNDDELNADFSFNNEVINSLIEKNFIFEFKRSLSEEISDIFEAKTFFSWKSGLIDSNLQDEFIDVFSNIPREGSYLLWPSDMSKDSFREIVFERLNSNQLPQGELKILESLIQAILLRKALAIVRKVEIVSKIKVKKDNALENILCYACWNFPMLQICSLIFYQGNQVAADIHSHNISFYLRDSIFIKKVENYFNYLNTNENAKNYTRQIPNHIFDTMFETFTNKYIFNNKILSWNTLPGKEILKLWINEDL